MCVCGSLSIYTVAAVAYISCYDCIPSMDLSIIFFFTIFHGKNKFMYVLSVWVEIYWNRISIERKKKTKWNKERTEGNLSASTAELLMFHNFYSNIRVRWPWGEQKLNGESQKKIGFCCGPLLYLSYYLAFFFFYPDLEIELFNKILESNSFISLFEPIFSPFVFILLSTADEWTRLRAKQKTFIYDECLSIQCGSLGTNATTGGAGENKVKHSWFFQMTTIEKW